MILQLKEVLTIYISPDHNEKYHKRKIHMDQLLTKLGFKNIVHYKSSTEKYPICLNNATIDIFSIYKPPFLLLEDDIDIDDNLLDEIIIPDNTDAFYLGLSNKGGHRYNNYNEDSSKFISTSYQNILKVQNMLSAHAILYINPNYIHELRNRLITKPTFYNDIIMSQIQKNYNIYCYQNYCFYQSFKFDGHEDTTRIKVFPMQYSLTYVTAFLNINNNDINNYFPYFEKLANTNIPIVLFMDNRYKKFGEYLVNTYSNVKILKYITKEDLHISMRCQYTINNKKLPMNRNNNKDTQDYLAFMNNKIYFVEEAMKVNLYSTDVFAWIDFRIFHILSDNNINYKLQELSTRSYPICDILSYFPGNLTEIKYLVDLVNWRFLGGFFILNKNAIHKLVTETTQLINNLDTLTWEVNIWAILEFNKKFNFGWYFADHNDLIILNL